ncbi:MAG: ParB/RepB/Spo0J family partition protein [Syntrophales bacterium]|nr:ParB/RepB/Spo0J family partition protein [Syntrophales bacterium]MCK9527175.1 ParB/RepB/Spo0J family partition protein [Syntrophales bacterium]MDX9921700.1 ParB/RepB/Spo0J family partition protein [Syntrophales bacterium]
MARRNTLGKGLGALFSDLMEEGAPGPRFYMCGIEELKPNTFQPRRSFNGDEIGSLADSIRTSGMIQPIVVRKLSRGYEIIAGERRWRAAQKAGLREVPVIIREATDRDLAEWSLIENLQREELNPIEEADAYNRLITAFRLSQEEIARRVGKDRSTIANALRLLKLPSRIKEALVDESISAGHARALLTLETAAHQMSLLKEIIDKKLSVREAEQRARQRQRQGDTDKKQDPKDSALQDLETMLSQKLMARVTIKPKKRGGSLEIRYLSTDELNRIIDFIASMDPQ